MSTRILIVDDDVTIRMLLRRLLEKQRDWQVCGEASNGIEAIERVEQFEPDVVVMDLAMPVMNGLQAGPEIAKDLGDKEPGLHPVAGLRHAEERRWLVPPDLLLGIKVRLRVRPARLVRHGGQRLRRRRCPPQGDQRTHPLGHDELRARAAHR